MPGLAKFNLNYITKIFEKNIDTQFEFIKADLNNILKESSCLKQIASLNTSSFNEIQDGDLVHFRCMVQDMFDPELYLGKYQVLNLETNQKTMKSGMFQDLIQQLPNEEINFDSESNVNMDRQVIFGTTIPFEHDWVIKKFSEKYLKNDIEAASNTDSNKRKICDQNIINNVCEEESMDDDNPECKKIKLNGESTNAKVEFNSIIKTNLKKGVLIKIYESNLNIKLNQVLDIYGIFSSHDIPETTNEGLEIEWDRSDFSEPRLHAIVIEKINHLCPLNLISLDNNEQILVIREKFRTICEKLLFGDKLATEYFISSLLSSIYLRKDVSTLGKFSLNLSRFDTNDNYMDKFYLIISQFLIKSNLFKMTLSNMNGEDFTPRKNYNLNRLETSMLQVSDGTHLFLDETALTTGTLNNNGVKNVNALNQILTWQKLDYEFEFYRQSFETDIPIIILSEGKSLLKFDCLVPVVNQESNFDKISAFNFLHEHLSSDIIDEIRVYISTIRQIKCDIGPEVQKMIEDDFIEMRRISNVSADDLHLIIVFARLMAASYGLKELNQNIWQTVKKLEIERKERIALFKQ